LKVFFTGTIWNSVDGRESFGALPYIIGALVSPAIEIVIGVPVSLGIAIFGLELPSPKISTPLSFVIELCCLWALLVFRVWSVGLIEMSLYEAFGGSIPFFCKRPFQIRSTKQVIQ
jgi:phosphate transport system permease protein